LRISLACLLLLAGCGQAPLQSTAPSAGSQATGPVTPSPAASNVPTGGAVATPAPSLDRVAGWQADIAALVPGMDRLHPDLFHGVSKADLDAAAAALAATAPTATDDQLLVGIMRIVAMVSSPETCDGHTGAFVWGTGSFPVDSLPLRIWMFEDDAVIVDALPPYEDLIGARIDAVDGHPMSEVLAALEPIIPRDNLTTVRLLTPRFLLIPQVLRGLGLADDGPVSLETTLGDASRTTDVEPIPMTGYNAWAGPYGLHLPANPAVRYLSRIDDALWWEPLDGGETLYVQYNRVDRLESTLVSELRTALRGEAVGSVILDLRHNYGGELSALDAITPLFDDPAVDQPGKLIVLIGRNTFSAGSILAARLDRATDATFVGEPTGGCPTLWGDPEELLLPSSGIVVNVATERAVGVDANDPRTTIQPDAMADLSLEDWNDGVDPAFAVIVPVAP
jgi:hypothetical protein